MAFFSDLFELFKLFELLHGPYPFGAQITPIQVTPFFLLRGKLKQNVNKMPTKGVKATKKNISPAAKFHFDT